MPAAGLHARGDDGFGHALLFHRLKDLFSDQFLDGHFLGLGQQALPGQKFIEGFIAGDVALGWLLAVELTGGGQQAFGVFGAAQQMAGFALGGALRLRVRRGMT